MGELVIEGYRVIVEKGEAGYFVITVPELPGCIGQVLKEEDAPAEIKRLIGRYLAEIAAKKPRTAGGGIEKEGKNDRPPPKTKR